MAFVTVPGGNKPVPPTSSSLRSVGGSSDSVEAYIDEDGSTYLWVRPGYGGQHLTMVTDVPQLYIEQRGGISQWDTDGNWHDTEEPLDHTKNLMNEHVSIHNDWFLAETSGPALQASKGISGGGYVPTRYRAHSAVPDDMKKLMVSVSSGQARFSNVALNTFEAAFWNKHGPRSWKWIKSYLPDNLPHWEMKEAKNVWRNGSASHSYISSVSLASTRRNYSDNLRYYNNMQGIAESEDDMRMRLDFAKEARLMASFYRLTGDLRSREELLRRTRFPAAKRLAGLHHTQQQEVEADITAKWGRANSEINRWIAASQP